MITIVICSSLVVVQIIQPGLRNVSSLLRIHFLMLLLWLTEVVLVTSIFWTYYIKTYPSIRMVNMVVSILEMSVPHQLQMHKLTNAVSCGQEVLAYSSSTRFAAGNSLITDQSDNALTYHRKPVLYNASMDARHSLKSGMHSTT